MLNRKMKTENLCPQDRIFITPCKRSAAWRCGKREARLGEERHGVLDTPSPENEDCLRRTRRLDCGSSRCYVRNDGMNNLIFSVKIFFIHRKFSPLQLLDFQSVPKCRIFLPKCRIFFCVLIYFCGQIKNVYAEYNNNHIAN